MSNIGRDQVFSHMQLTKIPSMGVRKRNRAGLQECIWNLHAELVSLPYKLKRRFPNRCVGSIQERYIFSELVTLDSHESLLVSQNRRRSKIRLHALIQGFQNLDFICFVAVEF